MCIEFTAATGTLSPVITVFICVFHPDATGVVECALAPRTLCTHTVIAVNLTLNILAPLLLIHRDKGLGRLLCARVRGDDQRQVHHKVPGIDEFTKRGAFVDVIGFRPRSEEHTSELQSREK